MKKVIIGILIGIAICVICAIIYVKCFMFVPDKDGMIYEDSVEFKCMTVRGCKAVEVNTTNGTTINFNDNQCLAIGYVLDSNIDEFIHNNFHNNYTYNNLEVLDYRSADSREKEIGNHFVIIPKSEDVKITLYSCFINEQGELELDNTLTKDYTKPFVILDDYLAETTTPEMCIKFEYQGFEEMFPIVFSGMDGKLDLKGVEQEVKDISVY